MQAFQTASETLKVSHRTQKAYYDRWARASDKGQGRAAVETEPTEVLRPSSTQAGSDAGLIVFEDDIFPEAVEEAPSEDPVPVQHPSQAEEPVRRSQREMGPPLWTQDYQMDTFLKGLFEIFMMNCTWLFFC